MFHAVVHIRSESSMAKDYGFFGLDELNFAGLRVRESVAFSYLQAFNSSVLITNDSFYVDS